VLKGIGASRFDYNQRYKNYAAFLKYLNGQEEILYGI